MIRDGFQFDEELVSKASKLFSSINMTLRRKNCANEFLKAIAQDSPNPAAVFMNSMIVLLSSSHPSIFSDTLSIIRLCITSCSLTNNLALVSSKLVHSILSIPRIGNLSLILDPNILTEILRILRYAVNLASANTVLYISTVSNTDPESIHDVVLNEVLIPIEPSIVQISRNPHLLSWNKEYENTFRLLLSIFEVCALHQPTVDFVCSSCVPMIFQSLLTEVEQDDAYQIIIGSLAGNIRIWKEDGTETVCRGRMLWQTLEQGGFRDALEQTLILNPARDIVKEFAYKIMKKSAMNIREPEAMM
ncbi:hypothetical protein BLNAU_3330 [Blattamonas nauphoetae]|uniref:Uncharacterized protein n=1 Tax=Blattamonas nauphoetae TaxID=2049346 RepID=A0ABQ9YDP4_9EUKA|nr:hypothetical protein BLNAU_3330 [Blattamonas nauphoetae]